tara:strand:- start:7 stop:1011 length:1005 start_codon:yes stop_codon:yes gene_type:complete
MATYKGIQGFAIQNLSSDPTTFITGQVWYNSGDTEYKVTISGTNVPDVWATGGNLPTTKRYHGGAGTQTATVAFGGKQGPGSSKLATTEEYNGSSWTASNNMGTARYALSSAVNGLQTAALGFGGNLGNPGYAYTNVTEEYDGSSWTGGGNLNTARGFGAGAGTQTAGLFFGGLPPPDSSALTEEYNGTSWTNGNVMSQVRAFFGGCGIQTAALAVAGQDRGEGGSETVCEEYNGTNWSSAGSLGASRYNGTATGTQTAALSCGGLPPSTAPAARTELYDGTSWTTSTDANSGRNYLAGAGTQAAAIIFGGGNVSNATEEFTLGNPATRTITTT